MVQAALGVIDRDGIEGCTMRAVAHELGVTPMALYRHVATKDELLAKIPDLLMADVAHRVVQHTRPMAALRAIAVGLDELLTTHSNVATLFLQPVPGGHMTRAAQHVVGLLVARGVTPERAFELIRTTVALVIGQVLTSHGGDHGPGIDLLLNGIENSLRRRPS
jgi:AcrR family transcriptional regulator